MRIFSPKPLDPIKTSLKDVFISDFLVSFRYILSYFIKIECYTGLRLHLRRCISALSLLSLLWRQIGEYRRVFCAKVLNIMVFLAFYVAFMQFFAYLNTNFSFIIRYYVFYRLYLCVYYLNFAFCGG